MSSPSHRAPLESAPFGTTAGGEPVQLFTLRTAESSVQVSEYGASVVSLRVPDRDGQQGPVVLGFPSLSGYVADHPSIGCMVGRYANRIANARFGLDGRTFDLPANDGVHHLHGGPAGFGRRVFSGEASLDSGIPAVRLTLVSPAGDQGYPGRLEVEVLFRLVQDGFATTLEIDSRATSDAPTVVSLAHHGYFNLEDGGKSSVSDHMLTVHADHALPLEADGIPSGAPVAVEGTSLDFRNPAHLGPRMAERGGFDDCFMLGPVEPKAASTRQPRLAAAAYEPHRGRTLEVLTDQPALQLYTANSLDGSLVGHDGVRYQRHAGLCLETQHPPDAPNRPDLPSARLDPGQTYCASVRYRFGVHD